jgi:Domain of unknown function (DUF4348)
MRTAILLTVILTFLLSCSTKSTNSSKSTESLEENFTDFFERFKSDSLFQIERVKFPWRIPSKDGKNLAITKKEWLHADFFYAKDFSTREIDAYTQEIVIYGDTIKIEQRGVGNGIHIDFVFAKIDNKWFLYSENDLSSP